MSCDTSQQTSNLTCICGAETFLGHKLHGLVQDRCGTAVEYAGKILREQMHVHGPLRCWRGGGGTRWRHSVLHGLGRHLLRHSGVGTGIVNAADDLEEDEQERKGYCMHVQIHAGNYFLEIRPLFTFL